MKCTFFGIDELYDSDFSATAREALQTFIDHNDNIEFWFQSFGEPSWAFYDIVSEIKNNRPDKHIEIVEVADAYHACKVFCVEDDKKRDFHYWVIDQCDTVFLYYYPAVATKNHRLAEKIKCDPDINTIPLTSEKTEKLILQSFSILTQREARTMEQIINGLPMSEIARRTNRTIHAVRQHRISASNKLRRYLQSPQFRD